MLLALAALVGEVDLQPAREECGLAEALGQDGVVVLDRLEDLEVRQERDLGSATVGLLALLELRHGLAALVDLDPLEAVAPDAQLEVLGERVDDGDADTVKAAGDLVAAAVAELTAGVQDGQHDL